MHATAALPLPRLTRVTSDGSGNFCPRCGSALVRRFFIGAKRCVQPACRPRAGWPIFDIWTGGL